MIKIISSSYNFGLIKCTMYVHACIHVVVLIALVTFKSFSLTNEHEIKWEVQTVVSEGILIFEACFLLDTLLLSKGIGILG